ncbi:hypothetical protein RD792_017764 [Penstemon davidsonii]|uniref:Anaphase-promoting complex subunit 5 n=1 Tax=Penstemon davidsonii TaxID=160366 RepID=A0ABR0DWL9_9LAMI|nr:hypothetical protein RD792_017764 [Penstemon davidsonii]
MATGISKSPVSFTLTPHKISICILVQVYAPPSQNSTPFPFSSVSQHNRLGIFILSLTKVSEGIFEPTLDELIAQLSEIGGLLNHWLNDHLTRRLSSLASPDDLFNFFTDLRGILGGSDSNVMDDDQIMLDPNSNIGMFTRRCLLAFNQMPFEGICHLLTNIGTYCKDALSSYPPCGISHLDDPTDDPNASLEFENMEMENFIYEKASDDDDEESRMGIGRIPFHGHGSKAFSELIEDGDSSSRPRLEHMDTTALSSSDMSKGIGSVNGTFLHTNWQVQGYLSEQANAIEKLGSSFPLNAFESTLRKLQKLAPDLHRVHFLRYLNSLYHDDYPGALENLHRYFDYSGVTMACSIFSIWSKNELMKQVASAIFHGTEGLEYVPPPSGCSTLGRYESALLCLGMMHFHFGHPKQALEVLTEAVRVSQQYSDDTCLAYTLVAISNLYSEIGISKMSRIIGSSSWPVAGMGTSLSAQQQLFVLLQRSLKRAESYKLKRLVASIHLEIAKYDLTVRVFLFVLVQIVFVFISWVTGAIYLVAILVSARLSGVRAFVPQAAFVIQISEIHVQRPLLSFGPKASLKLRTCPPNVHKEIWLSSHLINEFGDESSVMTIEGAFCTAWLKNLKNPTGSLIFTEGNENRNVFQFCAQPSSVPGSVLQLLGSSYLVRAASWEMYGSAPLARMNALVYATCFADSSSLSDAALAYSKLIQHLAVYKGYKEAFAALKIAEEKFLCVSKSRILLAKLQLLHECALHRGHLKLAQQLCDKLGVLASPVTGVDLELKTEASLRNARTLLAANQYSQPLYGSDVLKMVVQPLCGG